MNANEMVVAHASEAFVRGIQLIGKGHAEIRSGCQTLRMAGYTQTQTSNVFKDSFKQVYPIYNFSKPELNPIDQKHRYDNIRKTISNFWLGPVGQRVTTVAPTNAPPTPMQVPPSVIGIPEPERKAAALPDALTPEQLEELVINHAQVDPAWAKALALRLLA